MEEDLKNILVHLERLNSYLERLIYELNFVKDHIGVYERLTRDLVSLYVELINCKLPQEIVSKVESIFLKIGFERYPSTYQIELPFYLAKENYQLEGVIPPVEGSRIVKLEITSFGLQSYGKIILKAKARIID